jgi:hypothetical protein
MTFDPSATKQDLVWIAEIEPARRLEAAAWTIVASSLGTCFYVSHPEGEPSRVQELLRSSGVKTPYVEKVSVAECQANASSWYWDAANSRLYVHASNGASPSTSGMFLINSYFWERIADRVIELGGHPYKPLLDPSSVPELTFEATQFSTGGITQTFGPLKALNDGYWDRRLADYVYEGKRIVEKFGKPTDLYSAFIKYFDGYTGGNEWTEGAVVFQTEDPRRFQE